MKVWKHDTKKIGGKHYICGIKFVREKGSYPDFILENHSCFNRQLFDENNLLMWEVIKNKTFNKREPISIINTPFIIVESPQHYEPPHNISEIEIVKARVVELENKLTSIYEKFEAQNDKDKTSNN